MAFWDETEGRRAETEKERARPPWPSTVRSVGQEWVIRPEGAASMEQSSLSTAHCVVTKVGRWVDQPVLDHDSGDHVGYAKLSGRFPWPRSFVVSDRDRSLVVMVAPDTKLYYCTWHLTDGHGEPLASIRALERSNWRGHRKPISPCPPLKWEGYIVLEEQRVAYIDDGLIVHLKSGERIAALTRVGWSPVRPFTAPVWRLEFFEAARGPWRTFALGWLGVAAHLHELAKDAD